MATWQENLASARRQKAQGDDFGALDSFKQALAATVQAEDGAGEKQVLQEMQRFYSFLGLDDKEAQENGLPTAAEIAARLAG